MQLWAPSPCSTYCTTFPNSTAHPQHPPPSGFLILPAEHAITDTCDLPTHLLVLFQDLVVHCVACMQLLHPVDVRQDGVQTPAVEGGGGGRGHTDTYIGTQQCTQGTHRQGTHTGRQAGQTDAHAMHYGTRSSPSGAVNCASALAVCVIRCLACKKAWELLRQLHLSQLHKPDTQKCMEHMDMWLGISVKVPTWAQLIAVLSGQSIV